MFRLILAFCLGCAALTAQTGIHTWEVKEVELRSSGKVRQPVCRRGMLGGVEGPGLRQAGLWLLGRRGYVFRVRMVATAPGEWTLDERLQPARRYRLESQVRRASRRAIGPRRRSRRIPTGAGFLRSTPNGHALEYADGTPFFLVGDTWLGAATWRLPLTGAAVDAELRTRLRQSPSRTRWRTGSGRASTPSA